MDYLNMTKPQKIDMVRKSLEACGYEFRHPTLILEGRDGWFVILTPRRTPHQALVHVDRENKMDFFMTVPELLE